MFFRACSLQNEVGDPPFFFTFVTSLTHHLSMINFSEKKINVRKFSRERPSVSLVNLRLTVNPCWLFVSRFDLAVDGF